VIGGNTRRSQSTQCDDDVILTAAVKVSDQGHLSQLSFFCWWWWVRASPFCTISFPDPMWYVFLAEVKVCKCNRSLYSLAGESWCEETMLCWEICPVGNGRMALCHSLSCCHFWVQPGTPCGFARTYLAAPPRHEHENVVDAAQGPTAQHGARSILRISGR